MTSASQLSLARFAYNVYGLLAPHHKQPPRPPANQLVYTCDREVYCLSQLTHPLGRLHSTYYDASAPVPLQHVVVGGKNHLKLLALDHEQLAVVADFPLQEQRSARLFNVNTLKCSGDLVAAGLTNGTVSVFQVAGSGKARLAHRLQEHKRVVNSLDFTDDHLLLSGLQDGSVRLWDLRASLGSVLKLQASQHLDPVRACQYSRHARVRGKMTVLTCHDLGALCKFDLRYPSLHAGFLPERKWTFHTGPALSLHIHPDAEYVMTAGRDRRVCVWNYAEASVVSTPVVTVNTYGPVVKTRWCPIPAGEPQAAWDTPDEHEPRLPLCEYDFACLYLNDDPTISVFNLSRRYIPKEVVTTTLHKPVQNFIWAQNPRGDRKLWTITKSNTFASYNLSALENTNVARPLEDLPAAATAWGAGFANLALVDQRRGDFYLLPHEEDDVATPDEQREDERHSVTPEHSSFFKPGMPKPFALATSSPKDRLLMFQVSTPIHPSKLPLPAPNARPALTRNWSQTTQDSELVKSMAPWHTQKRTSILHSASPFLVPVSIPIPMNDEAAMEALARDYKVSVPEGFSLADVCDMNARVAAGVLRSRDSQVWRLLAVSLEQEAPEEHVFEPEPEAEPKRDDIKSLTSELGNLVGSYNSNSTSGTTYGEAQKQHESPHALVLRSAQLSVLSLIEMGASHQKKYGSRSNSMLMGEKNLFFMQHPDDEREPAVRRRSSYHTGTRPWDHELDPHLPSRNAGSFPSLVERKRHSFSAKPRTPLSQLSQAITKPEELVPWSIHNLLEKQITFARDQGDLVFCCTLLVLFYAQFRRHILSHIMSETQILECLAGYVDLLRRKELYECAAALVKAAPGDLRYKLGLHVSREVDLRFYCEWCHKLLVNEASKARLAEGALLSLFGFWYCDECLRQLSNCVYCNEPCRGLAVVCSLRCGHRGHFGCLQDWFLHDDNTECPGGCAEVVTY